MTCLNSRFLSYDGYRRLGADPTTLRRIVQPVLQDIESSERIPEWAGLDILRGTLFFIQRMTHHWGDVPPVQEMQIRLLVTAIGLRVPELGHSC